MKLWFDSAFITSSLFANRLLMVDQLVLNAALLLNGFRFRLERLLDEANGMLVLGNNGLVHGPILGRLEEILIEARKETASLDRTFSSRGSLVFEVDSIRQSLRKLVAKLSRLAGVDASLNAAIDSCIQALAEEDCSKLGELTGELKGYHEVLLGYNAFQFELRQPSISAGKISAVSPGASGWAGLAVLIAMTLEISIISVRRHRNRG